MVRGLLTCGFVFGPSACSDDGGSGGAETGGAPAEAGGGGAAAAPYDCAAAPTAPLSDRVMTGPKGYHGLAIDSAGLMFGIDASGMLTRSSYDGDASPFLANVEAEQIAFADSGDLVLASFGGLLGITQEAERYTIDQTLGGYGLRIGPDGHAYASSGNGVYRVDLESFESELLVSAGSDDTARGFDWSPALDRLYVGVFGSDVRMGVMVVGLDGDLRATGPLEPFANVSNVPTNDGIAVDACGNLYVADAFEKQVTRVTPDGVVSLYLDWSGDPQQHGHGMVFGSGVGGFRDDALYLPMPFANHAVREVVVGVPSRSWQGATVNRVGP